MIRRRTAILGLGMAILFALGSGAALAEAVSALKEPAHPLFVVYYFHGKLRCPTCLKIERLAGQAVQEAYADSIDSGSLEWRTVDVDRSENRHFSEEFKLDSSTLAVARISGVKVLAYKKLERVWQLVDGDENEFARYVQDEIERFMAE
jgi:hypothetical protein